MAKATGRFQQILNQGVSKIQSRGGKTAGGKTLQDPEAYMAAGLRRTGISKYGKKGFAVRQRIGQRKRKGK